MRHADDDRQGDLPAGEEGRDDGDRRRDGPDEDRRDAEPDDVRERLDVVRRARDEVAGAGALDGRQRQLDDALHELLAQLGEDRLAHDERGPAREPRDDGLHDDRTGDPEREAVDDGERAAVADLVDEQADDARRDEGGHGGDRVQRDDDEDAAAVASEQPAGVVLDRGHVGHGQRPGRVGGVWWSATSVLLSSDDGASVVGVVGHEPLWVPVAATVPSRRKTTWSAWSSSSGLADMTTVVRPARAAVSRPAMRASVCASTALVGSTSTSVSAPVSSARVRARRWRWPPEKARPRSSTSLSRPPGSASSTSSPLATERASRIEASSWSPHGSSSSRSVPVKSRGSVSETTIRRRTVRQGGVGEARPVEPHVGLPGPKRPSRSASAADSSGTRRHDDGEATRLDRDAAARVVERGPGRVGSGCASGVSTSSGSTRRIVVSLRAPMWARVARSTISVAVRSGMTRKAV